MKPRTLQLWRWSFIVAIALNLGGYVLSWLDPRKTFREYPLNPNAPYVIMGILGLLAWIFLLVATPFFFRSLAGPARLGFVIAAGRLVYVLLF